MTHAETRDPAHKCPDGCLQDLVNALNHIAQDDYGTVLSAEDVQIRLFYEPNIKLALATPSPGTRRQFER